LSVTAPQGFVAAGGTCGLKDSGAPDLAVVATANGLAVPVAVVVTANRAKAAPVLTTLAHLAASNGRAVAVVLNSGNANAATGAAGLAASRSTCVAAAEALGCATEEVLVCSTGLIGIPLKVERILSQLPDLVSRRDAAGGGDAAQAILTTDTRVKECTHKGSGWTVGAMAKGAAMLAPRLEVAPHATMLAVLTTDAEVDHVTLRAVLQAAVENSFNTLDVDGATSTNDTVILMASGHAGPPTSMEEFASGVAQVCADLAWQMANDAEGANKVVSVRVTGAATDQDAKLAARAIARSQLVQCSFHGADPYWGRVVSEAGASGAAFDPEKVSVAYGGTKVCSAGIAIAYDDQAVADHMAGRFLEVGVDLGVGPGAATITTTDLSPDYIAENMRTS
jgi:glutamate N-acetyltransferase/amino-acid N-acetyltransferase